ncbi:MAG TPA: hypothetical protein VGR26_14150 [Acidimicrobiales bacterium]|nr:hypothetical protein [Acidimicrobiales bacterium]
MGSTAHSTTDSMRVNALGVRHRRRSRSLAPTAAVLAVTLGLAACGDDDEAARTTTTAEETTTTAGAETEGEVTAFCNGLVAIDTTVATAGPGPQLEGAPPEEVQAALEEFAATLEPLLVVAEETAPPEVTSDVQTLARLSREALTTGNDQTFESEEFKQADANVDEFMLANCGFEQVEVTGVDYAFQGVPKTVPAGPVAITFTNDGGEVHELALARINDDVDESFGDVLQLPQEEALQKVSLSGRVFAFPGASDTAFLDLEPGRFGIACFIPVGSTPQAVESGEKVEGPPHAIAEGMFAELTVE